MRNYELVEHPNGQYWKIIESASGRAYAKQEAVDLLNEWVEMLVDVELELEELEAENRMMKDMVIDGGIAGGMVLDDYVNLQCNRAIYEYIAENDMDYWYTRAKDDEYDRFLINLCEKYGIELDYHDLEKDSIHEEIYNMEELLTKKLEVILVTGKGFEE